MQRLFICELRRVPVSWHTAIERDTKLLITWHVGKRCSNDTERFIHKLRAAVGPGRFQISTDGYGPYLVAIPWIFGGRIDFGQVLKNYATPEVKDQRRYSPATVSSCERNPILGDPDPDNISTSHVERCNLSMRMGMRRLTRLTNGHSKKRQNHEAALALWFAYYNYCRVHMTLKSTPAKAAGLTEHTWSVVELLEAIATH